MLLKSTIVEERKLLTALTSVNVERLANSDETEVLQFLAQRPIHTVTMMSLIHDNGILSPFNRGTF